MSDFLYGSICLSNIPKELIKSVPCKDGKTRLFLNISVSRRRQKSEFGHTHYISCAPKKEERKEGDNYYIGDLKEYVEESVSPSPEAMKEAPSAPQDAVDELPF